MQGASNFLLYLEGAGMVIALVIIVFLIIRRARIRKSEDFDKRRY
ncbi:MAG: hypothetical protein R3356_06475 [Eudoraea sp.]|nr:hypothetical protein [Eudoraea sp.]